MHLFGTTTENSKTQLRRPICLSAYRINIYQVTTAAVGSSEL